MPGKHAIYRKREGNFACAFKPHLKRVEVRETTIPGITIARDSLTGKWSVTHDASGRALGIRRNTIKAAERAVSVLRRESKARGLDWTFTDPNTVRSSGGPCDPNPWRDAVYAARDAS